eukprot:Ihof_evm1s2 gene=Ihof_evmTU1s2
MAHRGDIDGGDFNHTLYGSNSVGEGVTTDICHQVANNSVDAFSVSSDASDREALLHHDNKEKEVVNIHRKTIVIDEEYLSYMEEFAILFRLGWPIVLTFMLELSPPVLTVVLVGHLPDKRYLDGAAIGAMYMNITGFSIGFGLTSAMDTMCAQAFGAGQRHQIGLWVQRACLILGIVSIPICIVNSFAATPLKWAGQPDDVADLAQLYCRITQVSIPFSFVYEIQKKALQAKGVVHPSMYCAIVQNIVNAVLGYYFVYHTSLGFVGAAIARALSSFSLMITLQVYIWWTKSFDDIWPDDGWTMAAFRKWPLFLSLGIPGMLMMCLEWWAWEFLALMAGILPDSVTAIGANAILLNIATMSFMFYLGLAVSTSIHVANLLGAGKPNRAKRAAYTGWGMSMFFGVGNCIILASCRNILPYVFTGDVDIAKATATVLPIMAAYQLADCQMCVFGGIFRGTGYQKYGAILNFVAYYFIGLPLSAVFSMYLGLSVLGLWSGPTIALACVAFT